MPYVKILGGLKIATAHFESIWQRLKQLDHQNPDAFCRLVKACRNPTFEVKQCIWPANMCRASNHHGCMDITPYLGLIISLDDNAHAEIDPVVRTIVLASTRAIQMPRLISPLSQSSTDS